MSEGEKKPAIQVAISNLCRSFQEGERRHAVLRDISIDIAHGESVALRGRSGSGKSTLLNLISGIDAPDAGDVLIGGHNITKMSERDRTLFRREHIGFVYQAFNLVPTLTVADNIRLVLELNRVSARESAARIERVLDAVGLRDRADSFPDVLSGGEQQRVALARALVHQPSLLLADEPTGNLDDDAAQRVLQLMDELVERSGTTLIIATHSAAVAARCDRTLQLHAGTIVS